MRSLLRVSIGALLLVSLQLYSGSPSAAASGGDCEDQKNYLEGYLTQDSTSRRGSSAYIEYNNPDLCESNTDGPSASVAWVMVAAESAQYPSNNLATGYAQVGWGQFAYGGHDIAVFTQYAKKCRLHLNCTGDDIETSWDPANPSSVEFYKVTYAGGGGDHHIHMYAGGIQKAETLYDPLGGDWDSEWTNRFAGETLHENSDVPGLPGDKTDFTGLANQTTATGSWQNVVSSHLSVLGPHSFRYSKEKFGSGDFRIWTG